MLQRLGQGSKSNKVCRICEIVKTWENLVLPHTYTIIYSGDWILVSVVLLSLIGIYGKQQNCSFDCKRGLVLDESLQLIKCISSSIKESDAFKSNSLSMQIILLSDKHKWNFLSHSICQLITGWFYISSRIGNDIDRRSTNIWPRALFLTWRLEISLFFWLTKLWNSTILSHLLTRKWRLSRVPSVDV